MRDVGTCGACGPSSIISRASPISRLPHTHVRAGEPPWHRGAPVDRVAREKHTHIIIIIIIVVVVVISTSSAHTLLSFSDTFSLEERKKELWAAGVCCVRVYDDA